MFRTLSLEVRVRVALVTPHDVAVLVFWVLPRCGVGARTGHEGVIGVVCTWAAELAETTKLPRRTSGEFAPRVFGLSVLEVGLFELCRVLVVW